MKVTDTGCGISQENQQRLFKLFGYLDENQNMNTQGVGLGLYITKMIVQTFEGEVSVDSVLGRGSTFNLSFKLSADDVDQEGGLREINPNREWQTSKIQLLWAQTERESEIDNSMAQIIEEP